MRPTILRPISDRHARLDVTGGTHKAKVYRILQRLRRFALAHHGHARGGRGAPRYCGTPLWRFSWAARTAANRPTIPNCEMRLNIEFSLRTFAERDSLISPRKIHRERLRRRRVYLVVYVGQGENAWISISSHALERLAGTARSKPRGSRARIGLPLREAARTAA